MQGTLRVASRVAGSPLLPREKGGTSLNHSIYLFGMVFTLDLLVLDDLVGLLDEVVEELLRGLVLVFGEVFQERVKLQANIRDVLLMLVSDDVLDGLAQLEFLLALLVQAVLKLLLLAAGDLDRVAELLELLAPDVVDAQRNAEPGLRQVDEGINKPAADSEEVLLAHRIPVRESPEERILENSRPLPNAEHALETAAAELERELLHGVARGLLGLLIRDRRQNHSQLQVPHALLRVRTEQRDDPVLGFVRQRVQHGTHETLQATPLREPLVNFLIARHPGIGLGILEQVLPEELLDCLVLHPNSLRHLQQLLPDQDLIDCASYDRRKNRLARYRYRYRYIYMERD